MRLSGGERISPIALAVLTQYRSVTDSDADSPTPKRSQFSSKHAGRSQIGAVWLSACLTHLLLREMLSRSDCVSAHASYQYRL